MTYKEFVRDSYPEGQIVPWWKGYVYRDYSRRESRVAPLGFNVLFLMVLELWLQIRCARRDAIYFSQDQLKLRDIRDKEEHRNARSY